MSNQFDGDAPWGITEFPATVTFQPGMRSGAPTIGGTRLPIDLVVDNMWAESVAFVCDTWGTSREQCLVAAWFVGRYGIDDLPHRKTGKRRGRVWMKRWGQWATENHGALWGHRYDEVPDPPTEEG